MRNILLVIFALISLNSFGQKEEKIKRLLDSLRVDFSLTPNYVNEKKLDGANVTWTGKIEHIGINELADSIEIVFYCKHYSFEKVSEDLIANKKAVLKSEGDGYFTISIISGKMTLIDAQRLKNTYERQSPYLLDIGKVVGLETKYKNEYVQTRTFYFYTFGGF